MCFAVYVNAFNIQHIFVLLIVSFSFSLYRVEAFYCMMGPTHNDSKTIVHCTYQLLNPYDRLRSLHITTLHYLPQALCSSHIHFSVCSRRRRRCSRHGLVINVIVVRFWCFFPLSIRLLISWAFLVLCMT